MTPEYSICSVPISPLRSEPSDRSEIVSQILFGEKALILEKNEKWWRMQNAFDGCEGWVDFKQFKILTEDEYYELASGVHLVPAEPNTTLTAADNSIYHLTTGSEILQYKDGYCRIGDEIFKVNFTPKNTLNNNFNQELTPTALFFLNAPYLWGGKSLFGIDCSGFTQIVFKMLGIKLKRNAAQQVEQGVVVDFLTNAIPGDLAFFDNEEGKIIHVGIMLGNDKIIHASGKVHIDAIDDQGIFSTQLGKYTHRLRIVKRMVAVN